MAELHPDILEPILKRLDASDLIRCKCVCNSWKSFISSPPFIKSHLNHTYHIDCNKNNVDRRIVIERPLNPHTTRRYEVDDQFFDYHDCHLLGSANGLVCIYRFRDEVVVANPSTREVKRIRKPLIPYTRSICWGFGYDSSTDDYKIILGVPNGVDSLITCFLQLTLKSNCWKVIRDVNYSIVSRIGILCNGALHWVMKDISSNKNVILSFDLSSKEFKEIPQPDNARYESDIARHQTMRLGILEGCLCVFRHQMLPHNIWMMRRYNVKQSWGMFGKDCERKLVVHCLKELKQYVPHKRSLCRDRRFYSDLELIGAPIYVESIVSPHICLWPPRRKRQASNAKKSCKLIKEDPSVPGPSGECEAVEAVKNQDYMTLL